MNEVKVATGNKEKVRENKLADVITENREHH